MWMIFAGAALIVMGCIFAFGLENLGAGVLLGVAGLAALLLAPNIDRWMERRRDRMSARKEVSS